MKDTFKNYLKKYICLVSVIGKKLQFLFFNAHY